MTDRDDLAALILPKLRQSHAGRMSTGDPWDEDPYQDAHKPGWWDDDATTLADAIIAAGWVFDGSCRDCQANLTTNGGQHMFHCQTPEGKAQWAEEGDQWPTATNLAEFLMDNTDVDVEYGSPVVNWAGLADAILARWRLVPVVPDWSARVAFPHETPIPCYEDDVSRCGCSTCINEPKIPGKRPITEQQRRERFLTPNVHPPKPKPDLDRERNSDSPLYRD